MTGTTACKWDTVIPFEPMWERIKHAIKPRGAVALFGSEPFSSMLRVSNLKWYKYDWVWEKNVPSGFLNSKIMPLRWSECISIFCTGKTIYNAQMRKGKGYRADVIRGKSSVYGSQVNISTYNNGENYYPKNIIRFNNENGRGKHHPTQKPVPLLKYLVKTYTNEGDTVLDFTMGSGSTGVACGRLNRRFVGIEQDAEYFRIAEQRVKNAYGEFVITDKEKATGQMTLFDKSIDNTP